MRLFLNSLPVIFVYYKDSKCSCSNVEFKIFLTYFLLDGAKSKSIPTIFYIGRVLPSAIGNMFLFSCSLFLKHKNVLTQEAFFSWGYFGCQDISQGTKTQRTDHPTKLVGSSKSMIQFCLTKNRQDFLIILIKTSLDTMSQITFKLKGNIKSLGVIKNLLRGQSLAGMKTQSA